MSYRYLFYGLTLAGLLVAAGSAQAAQGSQNRDPHVCTDGPNAGLACTDNSQCPQSRCAVNFLRGRGTTFPAEITIIVDDGVSKFDGTEEVTGVIAVTILLQTRFGGQSYLLAQTYQNLEGGSDLATLIAALQVGPIIADTDRSRGNVDESKLNDALDEEFINMLPPDPTRSILDDVLWQGGDSEMADELRRIFGVTGRPVVASTPRTLGTVGHSNYESNGLASVVHLRVQFRFVSEP